MSREPLEILREAVRGSQYEGKVFLVGGWVRDKLLGKQVEVSDIDLVLEGDALELAQWLWKKGVSSHAPVLYPSFGTAMVHVGDAQVELVTARAETYRQGSRKPIVTPGTLFTDAQRRDFTINTFLESLDTGEIIDPLGVGHNDLKAGILRTPLDPVITFTDDPLRMLRACRFAARLGFEIAPTTYQALKDNAFRLSPEHGISYERVREELNKTLLAPGASAGLEQLRETGLLEKFAPELAAMHGVTQNTWHAYDVWTHTLKALESLPKDADLLLRLATLFHDIGKPSTRTEDASGVHFYEHEYVGEKLCREVLTRLKYANDEIKHVGTLVGLHMRYGSYKPDWTDAAVRRLIRTVDSHRDALFTLGHADIAACRPDLPPQVELASLAARMAEIDARIDIRTADSPLSGLELMERLGIPAGPLVGKLKNALTDAVVSGELAEGDKDRAEALARAMIG
ncbi:HDIG domain-containing metalloprotein [Armatimonas sp.]|uniref:CCA tRNA nucleotidyltransferase n=1 Tax=Armatimonas sp. TaxID=1872638 RepID=UPI00286CFB44|nr:HDIG domain-containing metalloprotein [Armatimonas sp.]